MRVAIIGSRDYLATARVVALVDKLPAGTEVISGGARGVDKVAAQAARARGLAVTEIRPDYRAYESRVAPLVRNREIVARADIVVAFWDGKSPGTAYTIDYARSQGKRVFIFQEAQ